MCMYFLNKTTDGFRNNQFIMSNNFPLNVEFETTESLTDNIDRMFSLTLCNVMCSMYYDENVPKVGDTLMNLSVKGIEGCVTLQYSENMVNEQYDRILQSLTQNELYEECDVISKWKQAYDSKFSK